MDFEWGDNDARTINFRAPVRLGVYPSPGSGHNTFPRVWHTAGYYSALPYTSFDQGMQTMLDWSAREVEFQQAFGPLEPGCGEPHSPVSTSSARRGRGATGRRSPHWTDWRRQAPPPFWRSGWEKWESVAVEITSTEDGQQDVLSGWVIV